MRAALSFCPLFDSKHRLSLVNHLVLSLLLQGLKGGQGITISSHGLLHLGMPCLKMETLLPALARWGSDLPEYCRTSPKNIPGSANQSACPLFLVLSALDLAFLTSPHQWSRPKKAPPCARMFALFYTDLDVPDQEVNSFKKQTRKAFRILEKLLATLLPKEPVMDTWASSSIAMQAKI